MPADDGRSAEAIREEIRTERAKLNEAVGALGTGAKRSGKIAGSTVGAVGGILLLARRLRRRRSD
jgi:hypothetical protein